jgi:uncharacterized protein (TIRG00374 family)
LLLTLVLIGAAALSISMIYRVFGDEGKLFTFDFFTPATLTAILGLLLVYFALDSLRFYCVLRTLGHKLPFWYIVKLSFINIFVSTITPFATGGGFAQIYFLTKAGVPMGRATAATSIRTLLSVVFFIVALPFVLLINPAMLNTLLEGGFLWILIITLTIYIVIVVGLLRVVSNERWVKRTVLRFLRFLRRRGIISPRTMRRTYLRLTGEVRHFNSGIRLFAGGSKKFLAFSVLCTGLFLLAMFSFSVLLIHAMGYDVSPGYIYQMQVLINFIMYFALTPGATVIAEGGFALMLSGHVEGNIPLLTLMWRLFTVYAGTVIGMVVFYIEMYSVSRKKKERRNG